MKDYPIVGSYDNQRFAPISAERTVNMFEYIDPEAKKPKVLLSTAGIVDVELNFLNETGGSRGTFVFNNAIYQIYGRSVFRITGSTGFLVAARIGFLSNITGYVGIDANTYQVIFVDGQLGWIWDDNAMTFVQITDTSFPANPIDVCYIDGFFIVAHGGTNQFQMSSFNNGLIWGPDFTTGISNPFLATSGASPNLVLSSGSTLNYPVGVQVTFSGSGTLPTGTPAISKGTAYFVVGVINATTFTISATDGGTPITFSTTGSGSIFVTVIVQGGNPFVATSGGSPNLVLATGTTLNYQVGTPITFNGSGTLPTGTPPISKGIVYYVRSVVNATTFTISTTDGGTAITFSSAGTAPIFVTNSGQTQLGTITSHPGNIVACRTLHRRIFLFSANYTEVWENAGIGTNLPIRRNNSLLMEVGTPAIGSIQVGFDKMFFLAQDKDGLAGVMKVEGTQSILISNRALDFQLAQYAANPITGVADARGVLIKENGLIFYRLNFTLANHTFVFNDTMSSQGNVLWHEEEVLNGNRHPAQSHGYFDGVNYYGDYKTALFYAVDSTVSTNNGEQIRRMRIGKQMTPEGYNRIRIDRWQLDLLQGQEDLENFINGDLDTENGLSILTEGGDEIILEQSIPSTGGQPVVYLSYSKDGGQTYGFALEGLMGAIGQRTYRTVWRKLGTTPRGQGFVPKIEFFSHIQFIILGAAWAFEVMPE